MTPQERIAREFHATYERKAPAFGYETRAESAVPWDDVPERNRALMVAVVKELLEDGVIRPRDDTLSRTLRVIASNHYRAGDLDAAQVILDALENAERAL